MATYNFMHGNNRMTHHFDGRQSRLEADFGGGLTATATMDTRTGFSTTRYSNGQTIGTGQNAAGQPVVTRVNPDGTGVRLTRQRDGKWAEDSFTP